MPCGCGFDPSGLTAITPMQVLGSWYSYRVAGGAVMRFQAPPPTGRTQGFRFLVYGDMGDPDHRQAKAPGCVTISRFILKGSKTHLAPRDPLQRAPCREV